MNATRLAITCLLLVTAAAVGCRRNTPSPTPAAPGDVNWIEAIEEAKAAAAKAGRPMLLNFTGSDWCRWCIRLDKEVFGTQTFAEYAKANLVLVKLDFPRRRKLPTAVRLQNKSLAERYRVQGYPTIILLSPDGRKLAETGYQRGGPDVYVAHLQELLAGQ